MKLLEDRSTRSRRKRVPALRVLRRRAPKTRTERVRERVLEGAQPLAERAREGSRVAAERARDGGHRLAERAPGVAQGLGEWGREMLPSPDEVKELATKASAAWTERLGTQPPRRGRPRAGRRAAEPGPADRMKAPALVAAGAVAGATAVYFLDPQQGRERRAKARQRTAALTRRGLATARTLGIRTANRTRGVAHEMRHRGEAKDLDDNTLAQKIESEVLGRPDIPKDSINVNAVNGRVVLRGECDRPEQIREIEVSVLEIPEVQAVENHLHFKGS